MICNICTKEAGRLMQIREETQGSPTIAVFSRWICLKCLGDMMFPEPKEEKPIKPIKKKEEKEDDSH